LRKIEDFSKVLNANAAMGCGSGRGDRPAKKVGQREAGSLQILNVLHSREAGCRGWGEEARSLPQFPNDS